MISLTEAIRDRGRQAGFHLVGITAAHPAPHAEKLRIWIEQGMHGTMRWMEDPDGRRADPRRWLPWARSLVVVGLGHYTGHELARAPERGAICRYACGRDYHREVRARLENLRAAVEAVAPGCRTQAFVDTSPVLEKGLGQAAGLGWPGKHTNLVRLGAGSWYFLGGLVTDLDLEHDRPARDHCGTCRRCLDVCPTRAIVAPYVLDARLCISYLTIENRGPIPRELRLAIGNRIFGCDDCQEVCPWNRFARRTDVEAFEPGAGSRNPYLLDLIGMTRGDWNRRFDSTPVHRARYEGFLRNVAVALGNWAAPEAVPALAARLDDPAALVRGHAAWALGRIGTRAATASLAARHTVESDSCVRDEIETAVAAPAPEPEPDLADRNASARAPRAAGLAQPATAERQT